MVDSKYKVIFWDFDGVLMNSNEIRDLGFLRVLSDYPKPKVDQLLKFHQKNGGLSRYVKFRYFFEEVMDKEISDEEVNEWAEKFSVIMKKLLIDHSLLIDENVQFVKREYKNREMHIVSGSDQSELRYICQQLDIAKYFNSINGSPTPKNKLVEDLLDEHKYEKDRCILIGDSINDLEAAMVNNIKFIGFNFNESSIHSK